MHARPCSMRLRSAGDGGRSAGREKCAPANGDVPAPYQRMPLIARLQRPRVADHLIRCAFLLATLTTFQQHHGRGKLQNVPENSMKNLIRMRRKCVTHQFNQRYYIVSEHCTVHIQFIDRCIRVFGQQSIPDGSVS